MTEIEVKALVQKHSQPVFEQLKQMNIKTDEILKPLELDAKVSKIRVQEIAIELGLKQ